MAAISVLFMQNPSFLDHQRKFHGAFNILPVSFYSVYVAYPVTIEIRKQLDRIDCELIHPAFDLAIDKPTEYQELKPFTKH